MMQVWSNWSEILAASYRDEQNQIEGSLPSTKFLSTINPLEIITIVQQNLLRIDFIICCFCFSLCCAACSMINNNHMCGDLQPRCYFRLNKVILWNQFHDFTNLEMTDQHSSIKNIIRNFDGCIMNFLLLSKLDPHQI